MDRNIIASHPPLLEHSLAIIGYSSLKPFTVTYVGLDSHGSPTHWAMGQGTLPKSGTTQAQAVNHSQ